MPVDDLNLFGTPSSDEGQMRACILFQEYAEHILL